MCSRRKEKPQLIPAQDRRICCSICLCQLSFVLSCVALVYLTVAVYLPTYKFFNSGYDRSPVMCQSVNTSLINDCSWASCGEWCLTKTSGFCPQLHVTTRQRGTDVTAENCTLLDTTACPPVLPEKLHKYNCNEDKVCATLTGVFNCSLGHCANMSELFLCYYKADGIIVDSDKDNLKLNGFFECHKSRCTKIKNMRNFYCERYCPLIETDKRNVYIQYDNNVYAGQCKSLTAHTAAHGTEPASPVSPTVVWSHNTSQVLLMSCHTVTRTADDRLQATDCINGTLLNKTLVPPKMMNFTVFRHIVENSSVVVDESQRFLPMQQQLTIYNYSRLYINLEGCVNTLRGECREFLHTHGNDGDNFTAQSRFPCYYNKNDSFMVLARFEVDWRWKVFVVAVSVPCAMFVVSFVALVVIAHSVRVGDDAKMRCQLCVQHADNTDDDEICMDGVLRGTDSTAALEIQAHTVT